MAEKSYGKIIEDLCKDKPDMASPAKKEELSKQVKKVRGTDGFKDGSFEGAWRKYCVDNNLPTTDRAKGGGSDNGTIPTLTDPDEIDELIEIRQATTKEEYQKLRDYQDAESTITTARKRKTELQSEYDRITKKIADARKAAASE